MQYISLFYDFVCHAKCPYFRIFINVCHATPLCFKISYSDLMVGFKMQITYYILVHKFLDSVCVIFHEFYVQRIETLYSIII